MTALFMKYLQRMLKIPQCWNMQIISCSWVSGIHTVIGDAVRKRGHLKSPRRWYITLTLILPTWRIW
jgi:hypothetical protein